jgi:transposase
MAAIVFQTDKRSGITYAYESISYWDKEKKQSRSKRTLIGRVDKDTKEIVATDGRCKKDKEHSVVKKRGPEAASRSFYGATYLFDAIGEKLGIAKDLKNCFGESYKQILSLAYYLILEKDTPLFRFEKWSALHKHPCVKNISSQRSSELFASVTEDAKNKFFALQGRRKVDNEFWAYDTTSISSYSKTLSQVQYGHNKEYDPLAQINLAVVFGESSNLPFYYRKLPGNMPDSKTVTHLLAELNNLGFSKVKLVMDRGFYSQENINTLYKAHLKFLLSASMSLSFIRKNLETLYESVRSFENYSDKYELYTTTLRTTWDYSRQRAYQDDAVQSDKRIYIHYYFNIEKAAEDEKAFDKKLIMLRDEIESHSRLKEHENLYTKYFTIHSTPKRGTKAEVKSDEAAKVKRYYGYFALVTNETMDAITALEIYRNKDVVEKAFGNLKERLNMRRLLISSEQSLEGKLFVQFIALIYLSYIKKQMQQNDLFKNYTLESLLDKLDIIECFEYPGASLRVGELLQKQKDIYTLMGIESPSSL